MAKIRVIFEGVLDTDSLASASSNAQNVVYSVQNGTAVYINARWDKPLRVTRLEEIPEPEPKADR